MSRALSFPPFRLDVENAQLWEGERRVALRHKSFALLCYLAERPGRLVTKEDLLERLWPGTFVSDVVLKVCVNELRQALRDDARSPRFIETVQRRGYRFLGGAPAPRPPAASAAGAPAVPSAPVGRDAELAQLDAALAAALAGRRQTLFVSGEAGIGKTTMLEALLQRAALAAGAEGVWIARGQCVAQYGAGEPFLPLLEGLGRLCRGRDGALLVDRLRLLAPEWLLQLGGVLDDAERQALQQRAGGSAPERMLRVLAEALDAIAAERPVVIAFEDLHWSDHATVDLIAHLAQRPDAARLLLVGTYRPVEAIVRAHPLRAVKQELALRRQCREITLGFLDEAAVRAYLERRFAGATLPSTLATWLHARTDGNPLFVVSVVDEMVARGLLGSADAAGADLADRLIPIPESLRQMIEQQIERLTPEDVRLLEAASVAGRRFSSAAVAAALEGDVLAVEERCAEWARRGQFLRSAGQEDWPDGTVAGAFSFAHSLYREHLYARIAGARRVRLHRSLGDRLERAWGTHATEIAAELALHFEESREYRRAIPYLRNVAERAVRAGAYRGALIALDRAFAALGQVPESPERATFAMDLSLAQGQALLAARGFAHPDVKTAFGRVRELSERLDETPQLVIAIGGLWSYHYIRGEIDETRAAASRLLALAQRMPLPPFELVAHALNGLTQQQLGDFRGARSSLERALATHAERGPLGFVNIATPCMSALSVVLLVLGHLELARDAHVRVLALSRAEDNAFGRGLVLSGGCEFLYTIGDAAGLLRIAEEGIALASEHALPLWLGLARVSRGAALLEAGDVAAGITAMEPAIAELEALGGDDLRPLMLAALGEAYARAGRPQEGIRLVDEALAMLDGRAGHRHLAELHRLRGRCLVAAERKAGATRRGRSARRAESGAAEEAYRRALGVARRQRARWWELRSAADLAAVLLERDAASEAAALLEPLCSAFPAGADAAPLARARELLARARAAARA